MKLSKTTIGMLNECAKIENLDLIKESSVKRRTLKDFYNELAELDVLDEGELPYTEEKVDIHEYINGRLLLEYSDLAGYMSSNKISAKESLAKICEYYNINEADVYVAIDSVTDIMNEMTELMTCSESTDPLIKEYAKKQIDNVLNEYSMLKEQGIKLVTKSSDSNPIY